jgi:hypothetical protein
LLENEDDKKSGSSIIEENKEMPHTGILFLRFCVATTTWPKFGRGKTSKQKM